MVSAITTGVVIVVGGRFVLDESLTIGRFVAFLQLVAMYYNPVREIADRFNILQSAMAALERIFTLLDEPEGVQDDEDAARPARRRSQAPSSSSTCRSPTRRAPGC